MEVCRRSSWLLSLLGVILLAEALQGVQGEVEIDGPSETECRPYIEKALRNLETVGAGDADVGQSNEEASTIDNISLDDKKSDVQRSPENSENENETQESNEKEAESTNRIEQKEETEIKTEESSESGDEEDIRKRESSKEETRESQEDKSVEDVSTPASTEHVQEDLPEDKSNEESSTTQASSTSASVETVEDTASPEEIEKQAFSQISAEFTEIETDDSIENTKSSEAVKEPQGDSAETVEGNAGKSIEANEEHQSTEGTLPQDEGDDQKSEGGSEESKLLDTQSDENDTDGVNKSATSPDSNDEDNKSKEESNEDNDSKKTSKEDNPEEKSDDEVTLKQDDSKIIYQQNEQIINSKLNQQTEAEDERSVRSIEESAENESKSQADNESLTEEKENQSTDTDLDSVETKEAKTIEQSKKDENEEKVESTDDDESIETKEKSIDSNKLLNENAPHSNEETSREDRNETETEKDEKSENASKHEEQAESVEEFQNASKSVTESTEDAPEEDLVNEIDVPENLRPRDYVERLLKLDREATKTEEIVDRVSEITLRELKRLYENAIKPLETLYKYRDLSNRHYGDAEIFSKPLILFMGPWSGGKSTIINYLLNIEYNDTALRTGAEPSPAYFNLLMYGKEEEILDGTQLAADYTFSGLQKFGQGLEERLRGVKLPSKLLEKVNIAEIPGILEVRKQVSRVFPFNDACQWFIDRADIIFLVYDPSKLDVGPETEAILDQLKGREYQKAQILSRSINEVKSYYFPRRYELLKLPDTILAKRQTRIVLNKADQIKPEELMRIQGALIWNISPLMSSPQPPVMYTTSLWSRPYEVWAPVRLLQSQERAFLRDLRSAVDKRIENKIASARRFAVRVRNHAKMVDCYLTTYYNHKSIFGNRKQVADAITDHPQDYHIYEGLSTLTNISRYDLPDPDVYKDFFRLNALYEFQQLSATCTYFRGCPINKLDVAIAYDFPELVGKHKRHVETALAESNEDQQAQGS